MELVTLDVHERSGWTVIAVAGQLDVATAPRFRQALLEAQYGGGVHVALDLTAVEFLDSFGLGVMVGGLRRARTHAGDLAVVCPPGRIRQVFEVTGLDQLLRFVVDLDELDVLGRPPSRDRH